MERLTARFFCREREVLSDQEIKFEEITDPATGNCTWFGEFYLSSPPPFESGILRLILPDGRSEKVKVIVSGVTQNFYFISFRSLLSLPPEDMGSGKLEGDYKAETF